MLTTYCLRDVIYVSDDIAQWTACYRRDGATLAYEGGAVDANSYRRAAQQYLEHEQELMGVTRCRG